MTFNHFLGIDISKKTLDAALVTDETTILGQTKVSNDRQGFKKLVAWAKKLGAKKEETIVCAEHTGIYGYDLQAWLDDGGIPFSFVPAMEIKKSIGIRRGKNDAVDATRIAQYAYLRRGTIKLSHKPSEGISALKALLGERKQYVKTRAALTTRDKSIGPYESEDGRDRRKNVIRALSESIEAIERQMMQVIEEYPEILRNYKLLVSVRGIGLVNAVSAIVYTNNFTSFQTARQYACYCGIAPFEHRSGSSIRGRTKVSPIGSHQLKTELTMAARSAIINDPAIRKYYKRKMDEKGKSPSAHGIVLNAVKFKLVARMFSVVKSGMPYKVITC